MLKAILDNLDNVPEALKAEYKAGTAESGTDGKFLLDVEAVNGFNLENVEGLKTALATERTNVTTEKNKVKAFEGLDPVEARDAVAKIKELGTLDPKKDVDRLVQEKLDAQVGQITSQHQEELKKKDGQLSARDALLKRTFQSEAAVKAIADAKGDVDLLLPHVLPSIAFDLEEAQGDDGSLSLVPKTRIIDGQGNTRIETQNGVVANMTIGQRVDEMKKSDKFARLFDGSGHQGTGDRQPAGGGGGGSGGKKIGEMTRKEKSTLIGEIGQQAYSERVNAERVAT